MQLAFLKSLRIFYISKPLLRGRASKYVTNGSETAVRDIIGFLCVSLGSSTVQIHGSLGSKRACASSVVKIATVLDGCNTEEQPSVVRFYGQKDSMQRIFIKNFSLFTVGSVCRVTASVV
jgi:hypothetical protein